MFQKAGVLLACVIVAIGGIIYELIIASAASYLMGNSIVQFSLTIGIYLFGMGLGSFLVRYVKGRYIEAFILVEILLSVIGGLSGLALYYVFGFYNQLFMTFFVSLVLIIGVLIGFEIPLLVDILDKKFKGGKSLSNVLTLDYIGALLASLAFPFILLPYLGVIKSALLVGFLNLVIAVILLVFFYEVSRFKKLFIGLQSVSLLLIVLLLTYSSSVAVRLEHKLYTDEVVHSEQSIYQNIVLTKHRDDVRLYLDRNLQFSSLDEYRYHEMLVHPLMTGLPHTERMLVLGGGDGLAVREVLKYVDVSEIVVVDIDAAITNLAKEHELVTALNQNALKHDKVTVINQDAVKYLRENTALYQGIIIDFPDPNNESLANLYTKEFYELVKKNLSADGMFVTQATSPFFTRESFWTINATIKEVFNHTSPMHSNVPSFGEWGFIIGSEYEPQSGVGAQVDGSIETRFITSEVLESSRYFPDDLRAEIDEANTIQNMILLQIYNREVRNFR